MISGASGAPGPGGPRPSRPAGSIWSRWRDSFGDTHLTLDAVVAHVDGELAAGPAARAAEHVARCLLCAGEVAEQRRARGRLRGADTPGASSALLSALRAIPDETLPSAGAAGLGADPGSPDPGPAEPGSSGRRRGEPRGRRVLPVAVASGLALGSVALAAVPAMPLTTAVPRSIGPGGVAVSGRPVPGPEAALSVPAPGTRAVVGDSGAAVATPTAPPGPAHGSTGPAGPAGPTGPGEPVPGPPGASTAR